MVHLFCRCSRNNRIKVCPCVCGCFGSYVFGANYASGSVLVTRSDENGQLTMTDLVQHYGHSIVPVRQDAPRAHAVIQTPDGTGVIVPDLGTDKLVNYKLDRKSGKLVRNPNQPVVQVASGEGPRHFVFHPCGRYGYLLTEIGNHIYVYNYDCNQGILTEKQCVSTLPEKFSGTSYAAELIVSKDGRFLYACNRGHDSIVAFSIDETGKLHAPDFGPVEGKALAISALGRKNIRSSLPIKNRIRSVSWSEMNRQVRLVMCSLQQMFLHRLVW